MTTKHYCSLATLLMAMIVPAWARAEEPAKPSVNVQGRATLEKMPETVRLMIEIQASGPDVKQALAKLKSKREAATKKLKDLGAAEAAISFEGPKPAVDQSEAVRRRMMAMRGTRGRSEDPEEEGKKPKKVEVALVLQAEWPVKAEDAESLLVFASELQDKIKAADLAGLKDEKPSEEEDEKAAEMRERMAYESNSVPPGEPVILYVCKISEQDRAKLLADAYASAKARAAQLATVTGMQVDSLLSVTSMQSPSENYAMQSSYGYGQGMSQMVQRARAFMTPDKLEKEAIGVEPKKIMQGVSITLTYKLK